jgi:hypothetical protein
VEGKWAQVQEEAVGMGKTRVESSGSVIIIIIIIIM